MRFAQSYTNSNIHMLSSGSSSSSKIESRQSTDFLCLFCNYSAYRQLWNWMRCQIAAEPNGKSKRRVVGVVVLLRRFAIFQSISISRITYIGGCACMCERAPISSHLISSALRLRSIVASFSVKLFLVHEPLYSFNWLHTQDTQVVCNAFNDATIIRLYSAA